MKKLLLVLVLTVLFSMFLSTSLTALVTVGEEVVEQYETMHPYAGGKGVVLERTYHWPNAGYIALHIAQFDLAQGDYLEISSPDGLSRFEYRDKGKKVRKNQVVISNFWASHIPGDTAVVRLYSKSAKGGWGFVIDKWVHGYEKELIESVVNDMEAAADMDAGIEAICSKDDKEWAKCYDGTTMYEKSKAVCRLLINGSGACTGWLIGNDGHVMTNNHCIGSQADADNTDFEFMAEGASCATDCTGWFACPGKVEATSATLVQTSIELDYALVMLPTNLSGIYGYMQLRNALPTIGERIYIPQHPGGKGKQLAVTSDTNGGFCEVFSLNEAPCKGGPGDIGYYADTEGGSSGSPVLSYSDNLVVALHHCANCPNKGVPIPAIITDLGGNIPNNSVVGGTPPVPQPPAAPASLSVSSRRGIVTVSWADKSNNENGFKIYRGTTAANLTLLKTVGANVTSITDSTVVKRKTYYYKVYAYNTVGESSTGVVSVTIK